MWSSLLNCMFFAIEGRTPPYHVWVERIKSQLSALPDTIDGLLEAGRERTPSLMALWDKLEEPAAWNYFKAWAAGAEPGTPLPYRLPTGEIVNVAQDDPA